MENNTSLQQQLLDAGVHFGHLRKKWNPKMLPYIFAEKKGIHIIDLNKTTEGLQETAGILKHDIETAFTNDASEGSVQDQYVRHRGIHTEGCKRGAADFADPGFLD